MKEFSVSKSESIPLFASSRKIIWDDHCDYNWSEGEMDDIEIASPTLNYYPSTISNTVIGDSPMRGYYF